MFDGEQFGSEIVAAVRGYVDAELGAAREEIAALRSELAEVKAAKPAPSISPETVAQMISAAIAAIPPAADGKDADLAEIERLVAERVAEAVAALPTPKDGADADPEAIRSIVAEAVAELPPAKDGDPGKDADPEQIAALISEAVAALPKPEGGKSVTAEDVAPLIFQEVAKAVAALPTPKDPIGLAGALVDRDGQLVVTLSDGGTRELGRVVGQDVDMTEVGRMIGEATAALPKPENGKDGFSLKDFDIEQRDERTLIFKFDDGEVDNSFELFFPVVVDRGVFRDGHEYDKGDGVTWAGSWWIAQEKTSQKPGEGSTDWRLAVKKGRDGKPADREELQKMVGTAVSALEARLEKMIEAALAKAFRR